MTRKIYVQLGSYNQCNNNGLGSGRWEYMIGLTEVKNINYGEHYKVRGAFGSGGTWSAPAKYRTSFQLTLIY